MNYFSLTDKRSWNKTEQTEFIPRCFLSFKKQWLQFECVQNDSLQSKKKKWISHFAMTYIFWGNYAENDRSRWYFQCLLHCGHHCFDCCCCYWTDCYCCGYSTTMNQIYRTKMRQDNFYIYLYHIFISCVHNRSALRFGEKAVFFRSLFLLSIAQLIHIYFAPFVRVSLNLGYGGTHRRKNQLFISMKVTLTHQFQLKW